MSLHPFKSLLTICLSPVLLVLLFASTYGCGSSEQSTDQWEVASQATSSGRMEYVIDSLTNENRRIKQQLEALAIENRKITARNAELETKLSEPPSSPQPRAEAPAKAPKVERKRPVAATPAPATPAPAKPAPSTPAPSQDLPSQYSDALQTYRNRNFAAAAEQFEALLKSGISADLADHCHYWIGQSYYDMKKFREALPHFETIIDMSKSDKKPDAQLMLANCYLELGDKPAAKQAYEKFLSAYPNSPYAKKARERLLRLK